MVVPRGRRGAGAAREGAVGRDTGGVAKSKRATRRRGAATVRAPVDSGLAELVPDPDRPHAWTLLLDGAPQSHVDLADPTYLHFAYQRTLGHVIDLAAPVRRPLSVLHLGGGAFTLARYTAVTRPRSRQQVLEHDAALIALVKSTLPVERSWQLRIRLADARAGLARAPDGCADLVIADVFSGARAPAHLATVELAGEVRRVLTPGGLYAVNLVDTGALTFTRSQVATVRSVFSEVCLIADPAVLRGRRFGNLVLLAANRELPLGGLRRRIAGDPLPGLVRHGPELDLFTGGARPATDAAPVASPRPPPDALTLG